MENNIELMSLHELNALCAINVKRLKEAQGNTLSKDAKQFQADQIKIFGSLEHYIGMLSKLDTAEIEALFSKVANREPKKESYGFND